VDEERMRSAGDFPSFESVLSAYFRALSRLGDRQQGYRDQKHLRHLSTKVPNKRRQKTKWEPANASYGCYNGGDGGAYAYTVNALALHHNQRHKQISYINYTVTQDHHHYRQHYHHRFEVYCS